jgi:Trypsin-co-occurring domain 1
MPIVASTERIGGEAITVLVDIDAVPEGASGAEWGETRTDRVARVIEATRDVFGEGLAMARDCAVRAAETFTQMTEKHRPDGFELQLGIRLDAEAGAVITKVGAGTHMQVTLRWENPHTR